jgi:hypothetical protein
MGRLIKFYPVEFDELRNNSKELYLQSTKLITINLVFEHKNKGFVFNQIITNK